MAALKTLNGGAAMEKNAGDQVRERMLNLQSNTDFFMTVFKGLVGYAIIAADFDGDVLAYNDGAEQVYGYGRDDVVGKMNVDTFFPRDFLDRGGLQRIVAGLIEKGSASFEGGKLRKNGEMFPAKSLFTLTKSNDGNIVGFVEITEDLTELKRAEEALCALNARLEQKVIERTAWLEDEKKKVEESEKKVRALLESANDAVIGIESPGVVYLWNSKAEAMFGFADSEVVGKNLHEKIVPPKYHKAALAGLRQFVETGTGKMVGKTIELEGLRRDGDFFPIELSISAINLHGAWNALGIVRDITVRKRAEQELRQNIDELERMNRIMLGRELKIVELKKEMVSLTARVKELETAVVNR